jgi:hypothetical protein
MAIGQIEATMTDPKHIFHAASDFRTGSDILGQRFGQRIWPIRATVVTAAFAAELYLKCLLLLTTRAIPKVHKLVDLYDNLPSETRKAVEASYQSIRPGAAIREVLIAHNATFVDWRYIFEKQDKPFSLDFGSLRDACAALHETTIGLRPDWKAE